MLDTPSVPLPALATEAQAVLAAIANRRSFGLKELRPDPVPLPYVELMLEAANWAPTHGRTEPWRFVVYHGAGRGALGETFAAAYRLGTPPEQQTSAAEAAQRDRVWQAPVWIAVGAALGTNPRIPEVEEIMAVASSVENALVAGAALGLGSKWTTGLAAVHPLTAAFAGFAPPVRLLGFVYAGWPAIPWPAGTRRPLAPKVRWVGE